MEQLKRADVYYLHDDESFILTLDYDKKTYEELKDFSNNNTIYKSINNNIQHVDYYQWYFYMSDETMIINILLNNNIQIFYNNF